MPTREYAFYYVRFGNAPTGKLSRGLSRFLPPASSAELLLGCALIVLSLLGARWVIQLRSEALALEQDSTIVEGKVSQLWITRGKGAHYHVAYEYPISVNAEVCMRQGRGDLAPGEFQQLQLGGPVAVKVCRTDPANHRLLSAPRRPFSHPAALPMALTFLAALALAGIVNVWWWACSGLRSSGLAYWSPGLFRQTSRLPRA